MKKRIITALCAILTVISLVPTTPILAYDVQRVVSSGFEITGYVSRNLYTVAGQNMGAKIIPVFKYVK